MGKNFGMSNLGYAIILVIIVGIVMIISAPMIVNSNKNKDVNSNNISDNKDMSNYDKDKLNNSGNDNNMPEDRNNNENSNMDEVATTSSMRDLEQRVNSRIDGVEIRLNDFINNMQSQTKPANTSENYVCSIEGRLDANNNVVPIDNQQSSVDVKSQKLVFVCQYK